MKPQYLKHLKDNYLVDYSEMYHYLEITREILKRYPNNFTKRQIERYITGAKEILINKGQDLLINTQEREDLEGLTDYDSDEIEKVINDYVDTSIDYHIAVKRIKELERKYEAK